MDFFLESLYWIVPLAVTLGLILLVRTKVPALTRRTAYCVIPLGFATMVCWAGYENAIKPSINVDEFNPTPEEITDLKGSYLRYGVRIHSSEPVVSRSRVEELTREWYAKQERAWFIPKGAKGTGDQVPRPEGYQLSNLYRIEPQGEPVKNDQYREVRLVYGFASTIPQDLDKAAKNLSDYLVTRLNYSRFNYNLGVDLAGGSILVYEVDQKWWSEQDRDYRDHFDHQRLAKIIKDRLDPSNLLEIAVRPVKTEPPRVEIVLPIRSGRGGQSEAEIAAVKQKITRTGALLFRLVADNRDGTKTEQDIEAIPAAEDMVKNWKPEPGKEIPPAPEGYRWYELDRRMVRQYQWTQRNPANPEFSRSIGEYGRVLFLHLGGKHYLLMREPKETDPTHVTGSDLSSARSDFQPDTAKWVVRFSMTAAGSAKLYALTEPEKHYLAIILDGHVVSAPVLNARLSDGGIIEMGSGEDVKREVDDLAHILQAGSLPAKLSADPVAQLSLEATLGKDTIDKGTKAVIGAFIAVVVFMIIYYRLAGFVASLALLANLLLTIAFMVTFRAVFTLPGLAGLVLMLGMAVDANVLIYERIREERERGGGLALSIRNGYDRAFPTIIDTHLTSIFTAIVLYAVGNDTLKGFGITLAAGLIISLFTALYMTRYVFDLLMTTFRTWITELKMWKLFSKPNIDFMRVRQYWFGATVILSLFGLVILLARGSSALNIDFTGGTAYAFRFTEAKDIGEVRRAILEAKGELRLPEPSVDETWAVNDKTGERTQSFLVRTTDKSAERVQKAISTVFKGQLLMVEPSSTPPVAKDGRYHAKFEFKNQAFAGEDLKREAGAWLKQKGVESEADFHAVGIDATKVDSLFKEFEVDFKLPDALAGQEAAFVNDLEKAFDKPVSNRLENFDSQLAGETRTRAMIAIALSWLAVCMYLWFRFGNWTFGLAAVLCLLHDLLFTIGLIVVSHYIVAGVPGLASILLLDDFKIDLAAVAALLTLVGFSVNDTIVVFDRIREVRGKSPELTPKMINESVNQTLSRTLLTSFIVFLTVFVLYVWGGEGIHLFSFVMLIGVIVGSYSSIFVASPLLLIFGEGKPQARVRPQPQEAMA